MTVPECHGDVCITCGDVAVPVRVVELRPDDIALVDTGQTLEEISVALVDTHVGGRVLVHAKEAIATLPDSDDTDDADVAQLFLQPRAGRPLPAFCLASTVAVLTALSNDVGFDVVYARQVAAFGRPGDMVFGISTSGGSTNVLRAFEEARRRGLLTVGMAGYEGGQMAESGLVDHLFVIPSASVHRIQEAQTTAYHVLWSLVQEALGSSPDSPG